MALEALAELKIDASGAVPKQLGIFLGESWDYVITVCDRANESCPIFPGDTERIHWSFEDPAAAQGTEEQRMQVFRKVRNEINRRIQLFANVATPRPGVARS